MAKKSPRSNLTALLANIDQTQLVEEDLFDMMSALETLFCKWKEIGLALGICINALNIIEVNRDTNLQMCLQEVLVEYVRMNYNCDRFGEPCWKNLAKAVAHRVGGNDLGVAVAIANAHPGNGTQPETAVPQQDSASCPVHLLKYDWYHGRLSKEEATKLLIAKSQSCFLVREDNENAGSIVLSLKDKRAVYHMTINRGPGWYAVEGTVKQFETVAELVAYYQINGGTDNSSLHLGSPCLKIIGPPDENSPHHLKEEPFQAGDLQKYTWYGGKLTQETAEKKLTASENSKFLVWVDKSLEMFLSLKRQDGVSHLRIEQGRCWYSVESTFQLFPTIPDLVSYYNLELCSSASEEATYYNINGGFLSTAAGPEQHIYDYVKVKTTNQGVYDYTTVGKRASSMQILEHDYASVNTTSDKHEYTYVTVGSTSKPVYDYAHTGQVFDKHVYDSVPVDGASATPTRPEMNSLPQLQKPPEDQAISWFHGKLTRQDAERLLQKAERKSPANGEGMFLIRESVKKPGEFVLSLLSGKTAQHLQIFSHGDGWVSVGNGPLFQGLDELVRHYMGHADGLPTKLGEFVVGDLPPLSMRKRINTEVHKAVEKGDIGLLKHLLSQPFSYSIGSVNSPRPDGSTPVHIAAEKGYVDVLHVLLKSCYNAHVKYWDIKGSFALSLAARNGHAEAIRVLVEEGGADVQQRNGTTDWVALHEAAIQGHVECVKVLLQLNAPLRPRTPDEDTPRELASRYNHRSVVEILDWAAQNYPKPRTTTAEWLHSTTSRKEAEHLLQSGRGDGSFLIRPNSRRPGYYALTLLYNSLPHHYELVCEGDLWYFVDDGPLFDSLPALVDHYMMFVDGIPTLLRYPVPPPGALPIKSSRLPPPGERLFPHEDKPNPSPRPLPRHRPPIPAPRTFK